MPTYVYECACGRQTERQFKMSECPDVIKCECGKDAKRVICGGKHIIFKGWFPGESIKKIQEEK